ncbi:MAG: hypothetical protein WBG73_19155 [Coleofasciculaceae cyanobacterium]
MIMPRLRKILAPLLLSFLLLITSCAAQAPSRFDQAQQESTQKKTDPAVDKKATQGAEFNKFFPKGGSGYDRVFTQEKKGTSQAKLKQAGKEVATLTIFDTISRQETAAKYKTATKKVAGYPATTLGTIQTSVLVNDRYQVSVKSTDPTINKEAWIQKFDLNGLSKLQ